LNASLQTIQAGLKPVCQLEASDRSYFLFQNGQIRRQLGEGHSANERAARREKRRIDYATRRFYKRQRKLDEAVPV
jgi:hypothetical protein